MTRLPASIRDVLDWMNGMADALDAGDPPAWKIDTLWFNSFDDPLGNEAEELAASVWSVANAAADKPLSANFPFRNNDAALVAASVRAAVSETGP